jgi:acyl-coenzyme A thioesterase PaaI-like protein
MSAIDTVIALAMMTTERTTKGTVYQHTHFLRPAVNDDFLGHATVLRFGTATAFAEARVTFVSSGELVAHATAEFAF